MIGRHLLEHERRPLPEPAQLLPAKRTVEPLQRRSRVEVAKYDGVLDRRQ